MTVREITTADPAYPQVFELRDTILRRPLGLSLYDEDTSGEAAERIFVVEDETGRVLGCVMLKPLPGLAFKLRQMAIALYAQGKGVGRMLVEAAERTVWAIGAMRIEMHARATAVPFYQKLGYKVEGEEFLEVGIPHFFMQKTRLA